METKSKPKHIGRNISKLRQIRGWKQEQLAEALKTNQQTISIYENSAVLDDETLLKIADALGVPVDTIKDYDEEKTLFNIQHNYEGATHNAIQINYSCNFNPIDKIVELYEQKMELYERLLKVQRVE